MTCDAKTGVLPVRRLRFQLHNRGVDDRFGLCHESIRASWIVSAQQGCAWVPPLAILGAPRMIPGRGYEGTRIPTYRRTTLMSNATLGASAQFWTIQK
jgi:hypothetical protein